MVSIIWFITFLTVFILSLVEQYPWDESLAAAAFLAAIVAIAAWIIKTLYNYLNRLIIAERARQPRFPREPEFPRFEPPPPVPHIPPPLELLELQLIVENNYHQLRVSNRADPETDSFIRPYLIFYVHRQDLIGRHLPLKIQLLGPRGGDHATWQISTTLTAGKNIVYPKESHYPLNRRRPTGAWTLRLHAGQTPWAEMNVFITSMDIDQIKATPDMELTEAEKGIAKQLEGLSLQELSEL